MNKYVSDLRGRDEACIAGEEVGVRQRAGLDTKGAES